MQYFDCCLQNNHYLCAKRRMIIMKDNRDAIDFGKDPVESLFRKMFLPTLVAMISMVVLNITDGAFVGHGVGSDALAAVNIIAPLFMIMGGIGMMFGIGGSVAASVHLAKGNTKAARINATQSVFGGFCIALILSVLMLLFQDETCLLFGSSQQLLPLAKSYLFWLALLMPFCVICNVGMFMIRLDGSPRLAMWLNLMSAGLNIVGDYLLIYGFNFSLFSIHFSLKPLGLSGAAIATSFSYALCGIIVLIYLLLFAKTLRLYQIKNTVMSMRLTLRNLGYQAKIGGSAFIGELAISFMIIIGNYQFMRYLGEDGVAAFSVACYLTPIAFMLGNAIVQSAQPIISFAHSQQLGSRVRLSLNVALRVAMISGLLGALGVTLGAQWVSTTFLPAGCKAWELACEGLPMFSIAFPVVIVNLALIGFYQSVERAKDATIYTLLRGVIFMFPAFLVLPALIGEEGLWLAIAASELATLLIIGIRIIVTLVKRNNR